LPKRTSHRSEPDSNYALAFAGRSRVHAGYAVEFATDAAMIQKGFQKAQADARQALALAPELAEGQLALAYFLESSLDFAPASAAYERAMTLAPGNAELLVDSGRFAVYMGQFDTGLIALRRALVLDPISARSRFALGQGLHSARRFQDAAAPFTEAITLDPDYKDPYGYLGLAYYELGDLPSARSSCETNRDNWGSRWCLAIVYDKLGQHADAEAVLGKLRGTLGDNAAYQYATIYAQWGNIAKALEWLDTAMRLRDPGLVYLKTDPLMDPLRKEPRFQGVMRELKFPE